MICIALSVEQDAALLTVSDNGLGIPGEKLDSIFDLFTQANPSLARTEGGLGVGLTLVRRLVELHGGSVHARSEGPGRGSEFVVRLPLARGAALPSPEGSDPVAITSQRVLVIEDNDDGREMLVTMLRVDGHEVFEASTGREGIEMAVLNSPAVVVLDIGLPDLNGYEVARHLRERLGDGFRLVALTGYGQPQDRALSQSAGFDAHLVKPVDPFKLEEVLQRPT
jgi:CheY-like chemotaxis protein